VTDVMRFLLVCLATYRVSELFSLDNGPYDIFLNLRKWLGVRASEGSATWRTLADLINCPFCLGIWFALAGVLLLIWHTRYSDLILIWLAIAGVQTFLESSSNMRKK
jgi:hypothetical protein